jgi:hypothetical protein
MTLSRAVTAVALAAAILLPLLLSFPGAAQDQPPKLSLRVTPLGAAAGTKPLPLAAIVDLSVELRNDGDNAAQKILLRIALDAFSLEQPGVWRVRGDHAELEIAELKAGAAATHRLQFQLRRAPLPPGRNAELTATVTSGDFTRTASIEIAIADCAAAFQADLTRIRIGSLETYKRLADDYRRRDPGLPKARFFRVPRRTGDLGMIERFGALAMARATADFEFSSEGMRYTVARWYNELKSYTGQGPNPGLCATNESMYDGIRRTLIPVTTRLDPRLKQAERAMVLLRKETGAAAFETLHDIALRTALAAGLQIETPPLEIFALLERIRNDLKDKQPNAETLDRLALTETVAWIEAAAARARGLSAAIDGVIHGIADAQKRNCVCAY